MTHDEAAQALRDVQDVPVYAVEIGGRRYDGMALSNILYTCSMLIGLGEGNTDVNVWPIG